MFLKCLKAALSGNKIYTEISFGVDLVKFFQPWSNMSQISVLLKLNEISLETHEDNCLYSFVLFSEFSKIVIKFSGEEIVSTSVEERIRRERRKPQAISSSQLCGAREWTAQHYLM